jgi:hypothetical protein
VLNNLNMVHLAYKLLSASLFVLQVVAGEECAINSMIARSTADFQFDLTGLSGVSFVGVKPKVTRVAGEGGEPMLTIMGYSMASEPSVEVKDGKLVVSHSSCPAIGEGAVEVVDIPSIASKPTSSLQKMLTNMAVALALVTSSTSEWGMLGVLSSVLLLTGITDAQALTCEDVVEVEIYTPNVVQLPSLIQYVPSSGEHYMESDIKW